jgi:ABC-type lipoprotein release transport system permease subunit
MAALLQVLAVFIKKPAIAATLGVVAGLIIGLII